MYHVWSCFPLAYGRAGLLLYNLIDVITTLYRRRMWTQNDITILPFWRRVPAGMGTNFVKCSRWLTYRLPLSTFNLFLFKSVQLLLCYYFSEWHLWTSEMQKWWNMCESRGFFLMSLPWRFSRSFLWRYSNNYNPLKILLIITPWKSF